MQLFAAFVYSKDILKLSKLKLIYNMLSRCRTVAIRILFDNFCKVLKEEIQVCFTKVIVFFLNASYKDLESHDTLIFESNNIRTTSLIIEKQPPPFSTFEILLKLNNRNMTAGK